MAQIGVPGGGDEGGASEIANASLLTTANEVAVAPNSRTLVAGSNITFDDSVPGVRQISSTATGGNPSDADDVIYGRNSQGSTGAALDDLYTRVLGVPTLIRRRYLIRNGVDGIVSGAVDDSQAAVNLAAIQAIFDAADANTATVEIDTETFEISGGPAIVRSTSNGVIYDSSTFATFRQRTNNVPILQIGDTSTLTQNLNFAGINLHYLNDQAGNTGALACVIYNQWKSRIGRIQIANTITSARPYAGFVFAQSQSVFSCSFYDLYSFQGHQSLWYFSNFGTGNNWGNLYNSAVGPSGTAQTCVNPFLFQIASGQQMHDGFMAQVNVEWCISNTLMRFNNVRGLVMSSVHLEQCRASGSNSSMINNVISNIQIHGLTLLDQRIQAADASDFPSVHKAFNNGRTNVDTFTWVNNSSGNIDRSVYEHYQADNEGYNTSPAYWQKRSWRYVDGSGTVIRDNLRPDRSLGGTDMDGGVWGNLDIDSAGETICGPMGAQIMHAHLRPTTSKTIYGRYMAGRPLVLLPNAPSGNIAIKFSKFLDPAGGRFDDVEIPDGEIVALFRPGTTVNAIDILNHADVVILTLAAGAATSRNYIKKVAGDWALV